MEDSFASNKVVTVTHWVTLSPHSQKVLNVISKQGASGLCVSSGFFTVFSYNPKITNWADVKLIYHRLCWWQQSIHHDVRRLLHVLYMVYTCLSYFFYYNILGGWSLYLFHNAFRGYNVLFHRSGKTLLWKKFRLKHFPKQLMPHIILNKIPVQMKTQKMRVYNEKKNWFAIFLKSLQYILIFKLKYSLIFKHYSLFWVVTADGKHLQQFICKIN